MFTIALAWTARAESGATAVATITNGSLAGIVLTDGGSGYTTAPAVSFVGGGGTGAVAVAQISAGTVTNIMIQKPGAGFTNAPSVAIAPPTPPATATTLGISMIPRLVISGQPWAVEQIQYTTAFGDTNQWVVLTNIVMGSNAFVFIDTSAPPAPRRFYRVVTLAASGPDPARWAWINPGTFTMGSPETEYDRSPDESPQTQVTLSNGFWMGRFEVNQGEYMAVVGTNLSFFTGDTNQPVEQVSWYDAARYCGLLTVQEQQAGRLPPGYAYRLPTEAEWEYVTRAGSTNRFSFGDDRTYTLLLDYAWIATNSLQTTHDRGQKKPNPWGVYDMSGNVWEWCADWYGPYLGGAVTNPTGPSTGTSRVMRGGSFRFPGGDARCAARNFNTPDFASDGIGFRVVLAKQ